MNSKDIRTTQPQPAGLQKVQQLSGGAPLSPQEVERYQQQFDALYESGSGKSSYNPPNITNPGALAALKMTPPKGSLSAPQVLSSNPSEPQPEVQKPTVGPEIQEPDIDPTTVDPITPPVTKPEVQTPGNHNNWTWEEIVDRWDTFSPEEQRMYVLKKSNEFLIQLNTSYVASSMELVKQAFKDEEHSGRK